MSDIVARIKRFNRGRTPRLLRRKFQEMRADVFRFYRGTCHLFYEDWSADPPIAGAPDAWVSGDLHPENFGSFRGRDGVVCFDVNDFDEAALGPCVWDVARCMTGIRVGTSTLGILDDDAMELSRRYLYAYCASLASAQPETLSTDDASGMVRELLSSVEERKRRELVAARTVKVKGRRRIAIDNAHASRASDADRQAAERIVDALNSTRKRKARYSVVDVADRIAGTGSLGVARYVVLAEVRRGLTLLDLKEEPRASNAPYLRSPQPRWRSDSARVVEVMEAAQASSPAPLEAIDDSGRSFVVKELQPYADRVRWERWRGRLERLEHLMSAMGQVTAWSHLRGAGWKGAPKRSALVAYAADRRWQSAISEYSAEYARRVQRDFETFRRAYDAGRLASIEG